MNDFCERFRRLMNESEDETVQRLTDVSECVIISESLADDLQDD